MQLKSIILYNKEGKTRVLPFHLGEVNIITGASQTGKSALIDVVDYCLGSDECRISDGKIRENVEWFAVLLQFESDQAFIARQNPDPLGQKSTSLAYLAQGDEVTIPSLEDLTLNAHIDSLSDFLASKIGIRQFEPNTEIYTRNSYAISFAHSRLFCFQPQTLMNQKDALFYKQGDSYVAQSIRDTFPYFLGAVQEEEYGIKRKIDALRKSQNTYQRQLEQTESTKAQGISKLFELIQEAKEVGLVSGGHNPVSQSEKIELLRQIMNSELSPTQFEGENQNLTRLTDERNEVKTELGKIASDIRAAEMFAGESSDFETEAEVQQLRLKTIGLFKEPSDGKKWNAILGVEQEILSPTLSQINDSLLALQANLTTTARERPNVQTYINDLRAKSEALKERLLNCENGIHAIYKEQEEARRVRDLNIRKGKVIGRISMFLESLDLSDGVSGIKAKINELVGQIRDLEDRLSPESKEDRLLSILNKINLQLSTWAGKLDLEYQGVPYRFDPKKLTVIADTPRKPIPLDRMGSGANYVACHLLVLLGLHKHFVSEKRPVPRFLFIDQAAQGYYPENYQEKDGEFIESSDEKAVRKIFEFIFMVVRELAPDFQVIITDHARLDSPEFKAAIREEWRNGKKLIPRDWYE